MANAGDRLAMLKMGELSITESSVEHLADAFVLEAVSAAKNEICALKAQGEGRIQEARIFKALAIAQGVHWKKALMLLRGKASSTEDNVARLGQALEQSVETYKAMLEEVDGAAKGFLDQFLRTARNHLGIVRRGSEKETALYVCKICGFIAADKAPDRCPVCQALTEKFQEVS